METSYSLGRILLLTYLITLSPYSANLFSNSLKTKLEESRIMQHLILLVLIVVLLIMFGNPINYEVSKNEILNTVVIGFFVYIFFILTTKLNYKYNVAIMIILVIYFLYESYKLNEYKNVINDVNLNDDEKNKIINSYDNINNYMFAGIFGITLFGSIMYYFEKQDKIIQTGGGINNFTFEKFWFN